MMIIECYLTNLASAVCPNIIKIIIPKDATPLKGEANFINPLIVEFFIAVFGFRHFLEQSRVKVFLFSEPVFAL